MSVFRICYCLILLFSISIPSLYAQQIDQAEKFQFRASAELGYLAVLSHKIQLSEDGTYFDYVQDGGQDVLFPFSRLALEMDWGKKNTFTFLYQPLKLESTVLLKDDVTFDGTTFPAFSGLNTLYNFPFFRLSYLRNLNTKNPNFSFAFGISLQLRNATISFESTDGELFTDNRDVGPVPILKMRTRYSFSDRFYTEFEADGFYAPVSYLNGSDNEVIGAILDASLRIGGHIIEEVDMYLNARYLGGGAVGTSDDAFPGDGYVRNWLNFFTVSTGVTYNF